MGWLLTGIRAIPYILTAVTAVERFVRGKGKAKQDAAVEMVKTLLESTEGVAARDMFENEKINAASRAVIDAIVSFQNTVEAEVGK